MIKINNLTKFYGDRPVVDKVSFEVKQGEIFGLLGPNGAGKTTTIKMLTFLTKATSGSVTINNFSAADNRQTIKKLIAIVPQEKNYERELSVYDNMIIYGMLYRVDALADKIEEKLREFGLFDERNTLVDDLSGGMQRRLLIARALLSDPAVLFLDEPTIGLDPQVRRSMWDIIRGLRNDGRTIFMTNHYIEEVEKICDRVGILAKGKLLIIDTPANLIQTIGPYVVEISEGNGQIKNIICPHKQAADDLLISAGYGGTVRRANLEDVFIKLTGETIN